MSNLILFNANKGYLARCSGESIHTPPLKHIVNGYEKHKLKKQYTKQYMKLLSKGL